MTEHERPVAGGVGVEGGATKPYGEDGDEMMTTIRIGPHTALNIVTIEGSSEPDRQPPMRGRGRLDHFAVQAASAEAFETIRQRLVDAGASDGEINDFGAPRGLFFQDPDGLEGDVTADCEIPSLHCLTGHAFR